jgi:uncharacterized protein
LNKQSLDLAALFLRNLVDNSLQPSTDQLDALVKDALSKANMPDAYFHGEKHWRRVAQNGLRLLDSAAEADPLVVFLFALFHDSMRENEDRDPGHGKRGRTLGTKLIPHYLDVSDLQLTMFQEACDRHTDGELSDVPTVAVCWDSDRLDLWRVGKEPDPQFMSTGTARKEETIAWAMSNLDASPASWPELVRLTTESVLGSNSPHL